MPPVIEASEVLKLADAQSPVPTQSIGPVRTEQSDAIVLRETEYLNTTSTTLYDPSHLFYSIKPDSWYGTFPYYFDIVGAQAEVNDSGVAINKKTTMFHSKDTSFPLAKEGSSDSYVFETTESIIGIIDKNYSKTMDYRFFLPIPPKSITHQHIPASEATATLGGVVEETSQPVFHTITLVGTTGLSMRLGGSQGSSSGGDNQDRISVVGRKTFSDTSGNNTLAGRAVNAAINALDTTLNLLSPEVPLPFMRFGSAVSSSSEKLSSLSGFFVNSPVDSLWQSTLSKSGISQNKEPSSTYMNGYAWSQALKQFFLIYQREKARSPQAALYFVDAKNNVRYRCVPRLVQFQKDSSSPFIETYNLVLKCWNPTDASESGVPQMADRFETDLREVYTVTAASIYRRIRTIELKAKRLKETGKSLLASTLRDTTGSFFD